MFGEWSEQLRDGEVVIRRETNIFRYNSEKCVEVVFIDGRESGKERGGWRDIRRGMRDRL